MARTRFTEIELKRLTRETADALKQSLIAGQPVTTKLIVTSMAERLILPRYSRTQPNAQLASVSRA